MEVRPFTIKYQKEPGENGYEGKYISFIPAMTEGNNPSHKTFDRITENILIDKEIVEKDYFQESSEIANNNTKQLFLVSLDEDKILEVMGAIEFVE
ncbi:hypothetical protein [Halorubrum persicum]|uniref:hypothetical protein n=1 Tax=Halorubrum persicum TaxID=1383844 RepID=UPI001181C319|nr:hypothetical protein [Halorubrum persicum]